VWMRPMAICSSLLMPIWRIIIHLFIDQPTLAKVDISENEYYCQRLAVVVSMQ